MRLVLPFGFYCAGNTGDEATLNGWARLLVNHGIKTSNVWVGSRQPELMARAEPSFSYFSTQRRDPRRWWAKLLGSAYVVVGGTPIQDALGDWPLGELTGLVRSVERRKAPLAFVGAGVENLHCGKKRLLFAKEFANQVHHWSPRSRRGRDHLIEYGVPESRITLAADLAWLIEAVSTEFGEKRLHAWGIDPQKGLLGVNLAHELFDEKPAMIGALASALDTLIADTDTRVIFFVHDVSEVADRDLAVARQVMACMKYADRALPVPNEYFSPREMMSLIGCCNQTVSMHYHFCIFSAVQGVPFLTIQQTDKVLDLCSDMDWTETVIPPDFPADILVEKSRGLRREPEATNRLLAKSVKEMRTLAMRNIDSIEALKRL